MSQSYNVRRECAARGGGGARIRKQQGRARLFHAPQHATTNRTGLDLIGENKTKTQQEHSNCAVLPAPVCDAKKVEAGLTYLKTETPGEIKEKANAISG